MPENRPQIDVLFDEAVRRAEGQDLAEFLDKACGGDAELRRRVERLLRAASEAGSFLETPVQDSSPTVHQPSAERPGTVIGPYKLIEQIGEGGMGTVWMAQQTEPVKRLVALKLIKAGMDSRQVLARFEAERQAVALMDHPNIAKVLDAGTTNGARPYFVMDLVKGAPITKYCDEHHLTPRQRLELFVPVCQAVQHAHQKGIIHRDLKPSNVLVALYDGKPVPKVIDFGVAKATGQSLTDKTLVTGFGNIVGTLEYMSPEQVEINQLDIDTRSDIYSLGVLLYELLVGSPPFTRKELEKAGVLEMLRAIREQEPSKPSTKLSTAAGLLTLATNRGTEPAKLTKLVRGELDWIVMKALEKDRNRRYESANGFAADVQRYLADEQVQACPPSVGYRLHKLARRNKAVLAMTALAAAMLLAVAGAIGWGVRNRSALESEIAQDKATRKEIIEREVGRALDDAAASFQRDKLPEALAEVKRAEGLLAGGEAGPELVDRVRQWRQNLGFALRLEEILLERMITQQGRLDWEKSDISYRQAFQSNGFDMDAQTPNVMAERIRQSILRDRLVGALDGWWMCKFFGRIDGKERLLAAVQKADTDPVRAGLRDAFEQKDYKALAKFAGELQIDAQQPATIHLLSQMLVNTGQLATATQLLEDAQQSHAGDFWINLLLAEHLGKANPPRGAEAIGYFRVALSQRPDNAHLHNGLGVALWQHKKPAQAEAAFRKSLAILPTSAAAHMNLGVVLREQGHSDEGIAQYRKAIELEPGYHFARLNLATTLENEGRLTQAMAEYREILRREPKESQTLDKLEKHLLRLGDLLKTQENYAEAEGVLRDFLRLKPKSAVSHANLGRVQFARKNWKDARDSFERALAIKPGYANPRPNLAWILAMSPDSQLHDFPRALELAAKSLEVEPKSQSRRNQLAAIQYRSGMWQQALETLQKSELTGQPDSYQRGYLVLINWRLDRNLEALRHWLFFERFMKSASKSLDPLVYEELTRVQTEAEGLLGEFRDPEGACREILRLEPNSASIHYELAGLYTRSGEWAKSSATYLKAFELEEPADLPTWLFGACSFLRAGETANYRSLCERMRKRFGQSPDAHQIAFLAHVCVLAPNAFDDPDKVVRLAEQRDALTATIDAHKLWSKHVLGLGYYRGGQFEKAVTTLKAVQHDPGYQTPEFQLCNWLVLAMTHHQLGQNDHSSAAFASAREIIAQRPRELDHESLVVQVLLREAETLLGQR